MCNVSAAYARTSCTMRLAACWRIARTCVTVWRWSVQAVITHVTGVSLQNVAQSAVPTGSGCMNLWRWKVPTWSSSGHPTSSPDELSPLCGLISSTCNGPALRVRNADNKSNRKTPSAKSREQNTRNISLVSCWNSRTFTPV